MSLKKEIIITGVNGFVGHHLARELQTAGYLVHGIGRESEANQDVAENLDTYSQGDLLDKLSLASIRLNDASAIIHLAGLASVADSFKQPERYVNDNAAMTDNLLTEAQSQGFNGRVVVISTGAIYDSTQPMPLTENSRTAETSPYSIGKIAAEKTALAHREAGMDIVIARPFNHIGPGQGPGFLVPDLWQQISTARETNIASIKIGNLSSRRDYTDVRDIARAYRLLASAQSLSSSIYNVSSGNSYSGEDILRELQHTADTSLTPVIDPDKFRPSDAQEIIGDSSLLQGELGWKPAIPLRQTIEDFAHSQQKIAA